ncbi:hypothetical protein P4U90_20835 [Cytobacillus kochii]|uniref:hypothetical protein n=1 Tax=Cytobacillus kochii TaxID=859143 RepID=UPI002E2047C2|nr:hypothetical protein [Cytobacillus kochii]
MEDKTKQTLMNLKMFIAGDECLESSYSDVLEIEELIEKQQQEMEKLKQVAKDLNNDLFHERVEKDKFEQKIEELKNELDRQIQIGYSFEGRVVDQQQEIEWLKKINARLWQEVRGGNSVELHNRQHADPQG